MIRYRSRRPPETELRTRLRELPISGAGLTSSALDLWPMRDYCRVERQNIGDDQAHWPFACRIRT